MTIIPENQNNLFLLSEEQDNARFELPNTTNRVNQRTGVLRYMSKHAHCSNRLITLISAPTAHLKNHLPSKTSCYGNNLPCPTMYLPLHKYINFDF